MSALLEAAKLGLGYAERDLECLIESHCLMNPDLTPRLETLDEDVLPLVKLRQVEINLIRDAIARNIRVQTIARVERNAAFLFGIVLGGAIGAAIAMVAL